LKSEISLQPTNGLSVPAVIDPAVFEPVVFDAVVSEPVEPELVAEPIADEKLSVPRQVTSTRSPGETFSSFERLRTISVYVPGSVPAVQMLPVALSIEPVPVVSALIMLPDVLPLRDVP